MISKLAEWVSYDIFNFSRNAHFGNALAFFIEDTIKIFLLLAVITLLMSLLRSYLPIEKIRDFLRKNKLYGLDYFFAALFGALTPFCSCSSIPIFIGFMEAGIPLGVAFAFLITSPLVNEIALAMLVAVFGLKVAIIYAIAGMIIGMVGGFILNKLKLEKYVEDYVWKIKSQRLATETKKISFAFRAKIISKEAFGIIKKIGVYVLLGVVLGAIIHGFVPTGFFEQYITKDNFLAVPLAVILGVPMYANATGVVPIIQSLVSKGVPLGTSLAFMMAIVGLSLPEALILKKIMKMKLLLLFFGVVTLGIIILGYFFNIIF